MPFIEDNQNIKTGDKIRLNDPQGNICEFTVNIGDALLNGDDDQIWLCRVSASQKTYLRKRPIGQMSIGEALFASFDELSQTLKSGNFYID